MTANRATNRPPLTALTKMSDGVDMHFLFRPQAARVAGTETLRAVACR